MKLSLLAFVLLVSLPPAAMAAAVSCPDLATAAQVAACPTEAELEYTFTGYCSDNSRMYKNDDDVCNDYKRYRTLKNIALWESGDGAFNAYVSCDLPPEKLKSAKVSSVKVGKQGKMTQVICGYGDGLNFTYRTRSECKVEGTHCASNPADCKASCN
jgi:hypothetical protein